MPNTHSTLTGLFTDIANSIRAKTGSSAPIIADAFPSAIAAIPSGGGDSKEDEIIARTISGVYTNTTVESIGYNAFFSCKRLTSVSFPVCISIGSNAFYGCTSLTSVSFPLCTSIGSSAF